MEITTSHLISQIKFLNHSTLSPNPSSSISLISDCRRRKPIAIAFAKCMKPLTNKRSVALVANDPRNHASLIVVPRASADQSSPSSTDTKVTWLLEPVGDGDWKHIGYRVDIPGPFEIASSEVTVGRLPDKVGMVLPVATVSGMHARIQKQGGELLITDLDSTNGTFINEKRLIPGEPSIVPEGSRVTFGDTHLAIFRVFKLEVTEPSNETSEPTTDARTNVAT